MGPTDSTRSGRGEDDEQTGSLSTVQAPWEYHGQDLSRVLALSDGVFAFAATLLVLSLALPLGTQGAAVRTYLLSSDFLRPLYSYAISFLVISLWWRGHHLVFSYIRAYDGTLVRLNFVFLLFVAILPFATGVLTSSGSDPVGAVFFSLLQVASGIALGGVWLYASGRGQLVVMDLPGEWQRFIVRSVFFRPLFFAISLPLAFISVDLAEAIWVGIVLLPWLTRIGSRVEKA